MEKPIHSIESLFKQLGLACTAEAITDFVNENAPLPDNVKIHEADIWNESQCSFLKQMMLEDADWAAVVDQLNVLLRQKKTH